jgi:hypothetical protein
MSSNPDHAGAARPQGAPDAAALHARFLAILPAVEKHGRVYFRHLKCLHRLEEILAEMRALAWKWFLKLVQKGKDAAHFPSMVASFAARAVRSGRRLCGQEKAKDVLSSRAQQRKGFCVQSFPEHDSSVDDNATLDALRDNTKSPPDEQAAFRIDFPAWLLRQTERNRRVAVDMSMGEKTKDLADRYGTTQGRISQLRREFKDDWAAFCDAPPARRVTS